jgi:hypothetical protein
MDMYSSAYCPTLYVVATGMKWADLVKRSTMTHIELYPREVRGKPTTDLSPTVPYSILHFPLVVRWGMERPRCENRALACEEMACMRFSPSRWS